jgi:hypothetical protein
MTDKKTSFKAALIKVKLGESNIWFWKSTTSNAQISPEFFSQKDAEKWFDDVMLVHEETYDLIDRSKHGEFYTVRGFVSLEELFINYKVSECPYMMYMNDEVLEVIVLALSEEDAKRRVEKYIDNIQWIDL